MVPHHAGAEANILIEFHAASAARVMIGTATDFIHHRHAVLYSVNLTIT